MHDDSLPTAEPPTTVYDVLGGQAWFDELVGHFYAGVAEDPVLRGLYPEDDLGPASQRLAGFLAQYWGGPPDYSRERGHPRLRMRHAPFVIGGPERDAWLAHMRAALTAMDPPAPVMVAMDEYFTTAADHMINKPG